MFKKDYIDLIYRVICLFTFTVVIILSKSLITLAVLTIYFFFITRSDSDFLFIFFYLLSLFFLVIAFFSESFVFIKIMSIIDYCFYYLDMPRLDKRLNNKLHYIVDQKFNIQEEVKGGTIEDNKILDESEIDYIRFKASRKEKKEEKAKSDIIPTLYLAAHLIVLFISIAIG